MCTYLYSVCHLFSAYATAHGIDIVLSSLVPFVSAVLLSVHQLDQITVYIYPTHHFLGKTPHISPILAP